MCSQDIWNLLFYSEHQWNAKVYQKKSTGFRMKQNDRQNQGTKNTQIPYYNLNSDSSLLRIK